MNSSTPAYAKNNDRVGTKGRSLVNDSDSCVDNIKIKIKSIIRSYFKAAVAICTKNEVIIFRSNQ